jgi:hypothetical protein
MLTALSSLASSQAKATKDTAKGVVQLLNYAATHPEAVIRFHASDMILHVKSDASYLSEPRAHSRVAGYHYLSDHPNKKAELTLNGPILVVCNILKNVMASASEAETAGLFHNCQEACPLRTALEEMGWKQPATPVVTDNAVSSGIANDTVKQRRSRAIDMRFYWIRDRVKQGQFRIHWKPGKRNLADYFTKHHPPGHHQAMRPIYLHEPNLDSVRGCVDTSGASASTESRGTVIAGVVHAKYRGTDTSVDDSSVFS